MTAMLLAVGSEVGLTVADTSGVAGDGLGVDLLSLARTAAAEGALSLQLRKYHVPAPPATRQASASESEATWTPLLSGVEDDAGAGAARAERRGRCVVGASRELRIPADEPLESSPATVLPDPAVYPPLADGWRAACRPRFAGRMLAVEWWAVTAAGCPLLRRWARCRVPQPATRTCRQVQGWWGAVRGR